MIVPDVNLLIYAHNDMAPDHDGDFARFGGLRWRNPLLGGR